MGGFVITRDKLCRIVPIENAAMPERRIIQWDKDDLEAIGLMKIDVLALGMLSAIRRTLDLISARRGLPFQIQDIPAEDEATYDMICEADTIGVFQIESRAQMSMLPRLRPREFYDLVIEVGIVRPGPIQGGMVHPYLRRRQKKEPVTYPGDGVKAALERTLGVPISRSRSCNWQYRLPVLPLAKQINYGAPWLPGKKKVNSPLSTPKLHRGNGQSRLYKRICRTDFQANPGLWGIWIPGITFRKLCATRICIGLA